MKKASKFEKVAARCWNLLNEGKPFTPIFVTGTMILYYFTSFKDIEFFRAFLLSFLLTLPFIILFNRYDFPLFLRNYLWIPLIAYLLIWKEVNLSLWALAIGLYFFLYRVFLGHDLLSFTNWNIMAKFHKILEVGPEK